MKRRKQIYEEICEENKSAFELLSSQVVTLSNTETPNRGNRI